MLCLSNTHGFIKIVGRSSGESLRRSVALLKNRYASGKVDQLLANKIKMKQADRPDSVTTASLLL